jgi:hypothetical protein
MTHHGQETIDDLLSPDLLIRGAYSVGIALVPGIIGAEMHAYAKTLRERYRQNRTEPGLFSRVVYGFHDTPAGYDYHRRWASLTHALPVIMTWVPMVYAYVNGFADENGKQLVFGIALHALRAGTIFAFDTIRARHLDKRVETLAR